MKFGEKLRQARMKLGLTQEELSLRLGVTCRTLQNYESGGVYPKKREIYTRLAEFFDTDLDYWLAEGRESPAEEGKNRREDVQDLASRVSSLLSDSELSEEELDRFMRTVQDAYWTAKDKSREASR